METINLFHKRKPTTLGKHWKIKDTSKMKKSEEQRRKQSESMKGHKPYNTIEGNRKISEAHKGIPRPEYVKKKMSLKMKLRTGSLASRWKGGYSIGKYSVDWTKTLRISIRERDKYICQICRDNQGDRAFSVHHIDYNKLNCDPNNLVTLCVSCHIKTNSRRIYWKNYFNQIIK